MSYLGLLKLRTLHSVHSIISSKVSSLYQWLQSCRPHLITVYHLIVLYITNWNVRLHYLFWKAAGEVNRSYVMTTSTVCVNWPVVYSVTKHSTEQSRLAAAQCSCILLNLFHPWTAVECGQYAESQDACPQKGNQAVAVKLHGRPMQWYEVGGCNHLQTQIRIIFRIRRFG